MRNAQGVSTGLRDELSRLGYQARDQERQHEIALNRLQTDAQSQIDAARNDVAQVRFQLAGARQALQQLAASQTDFTSEARDAMQAANVQVGLLAQKLGTAETQLAIMNDAVAQLQPRHVNETAKAALLAFAQRHPGRYAIHSVPGLDDAAGLVQEISDAVVAGGAPRPDWDSQFTPTRKIDHVLVTGPDRRSAFDLATAMLTVDRHTAYVDGPTNDGYSIYLGTRS